MPSEAAKMPLEYAEEFTKIFHELHELKKQVCLLQDRQPFIVPIRSLAPWRLKVIKDIPALVQVTDEEYLATFFDANIGISGDTPEEAVSNLKALLVDMYESLAAEESILGPEPFRQLKTLREFIQKEE